VLAGTVKLIARVLVCAALFSSAAFAQTQPPIITIDAPGAGQGTIATAIKTAAVITGFYVDANSKCHGFIRNPDGTFISFDSPQPQEGIHSCARVTSINNSGVVTGSYEDAGFGCPNGIPDFGCGGVRAFARMPDGTIITFDAPVDPSNTNPGTVPASINPAGNIAGSYDPCGQGLCSSGFLRTSDGTSISFDAPGVNRFFGTITRSINAMGVIAGNFGDSNSVMHGFLRHPDGSFTVFDTGNSDCGFDANAINASGNVGGSFCTNNAFHGYLRARDGSFTSFDVPGALTISVKALNDRGVVAGMYRDSNFVVLGYLRAADGTITTLDVPAANGRFRVTLYGDHCLNNSGAVVGSYPDTNGANHGFLLPSGDD